MRLLVGDEKSELLREPYVVRLGGWSLDRYAQRLFQYPLPPVARCLQELLEPPPE